MLSALGSYGAFSSYGGLARLCKEKRLNEVLQASNVVGLQKSLTPKQLLYQSLQGCICKKDLAAGKEVYKLMLHTELRIDSFLGSQLIRMFASCGSLLDANTVFVNLMEPSVFAWSAIISAHAIHGEGEQAIQLYHHMLLAGIKADAFVIVAVLQACASTASLLEGKSVHASIIHNAFEPNEFVASSLIDMYIKCGRLEDAHGLFQRLPKRDAVIWNAIMSGYAQVGKCKEVLMFLNQLHGEGVELNIAFLVTLLKTCANATALDEGRLIHTEIAQRSLDLNLGINNSLINMYAKCSSLEDARRVFKRMLKHDVVTWNAMIAGCLSAGHYSCALLYLQEMQLEGEKPDHITLVSIVKACSCLADPGRGMLIHAYIVEDGLDASQIMRNSLVDMYVNCGSFDDALRFFYSSSEKSMVMWSVIITGCVQQGQYDKAFQFVKRVHETGMKLDRVALSTMLKACVGKSGFNLGRLIHMCLAISCFELDSITGTSLIDMYANGGGLEDAQHVFDKLRSRDVVTWTAIMTGYAQHGHSQTALYLFQQMQRDGIKPNMVTFLTVLRACYEASDLQGGKLLHSKIIQGFLDSETCIGNTLISMYTKCGSFEDGRRVFDTLRKDDVATWNAMLEGYVWNGQRLGVFSLFGEMLQFGPAPDSATFHSILKACSMKTRIGQGRLVHHHIIESCSVIGNSLTNTLIDMYAKCGSLDNARSLFDKHTQHDAVTWSAMTSGYLSYEQWEEAFIFLQHIPLEYLELDKVLFLNLLEASANLAALEQGRIVHSIVVECAFETDIKVGSSLINMYAKSDSVEDACTVFDTLPERDTATWNAIIFAHAENMNAELGLKCVQQMQEAGMEPNMVTFVHLFGACSKMGFEHEGLRLYKAMKESSNSLVELEHYNCIVVLLGHAGKVEEAKDLLCTLPFSHNLLGWICCLNHVGKHGIVDLARHCFPLSVYSPQHLRPELCAVFDMHCIL